MSTAIAIEEARNVLRLYYSDLPLDVILAAYSLQESRAFTVIRDAEERLVAAKNVICKARAQQSQKACHLPD